MKTHLRQLLKVEGVSIKKASERSGVPAGTIEKWFYRGVDPTVNNFEKVLAAIGYRIELVKEEK